jgi:hypothetical protein
MYPMNACAIGVRMAQAVIQIDRAFNLRHIVSTDYTALEITGSMKIVGDVDLLPPITIGRITINAS